MTFVGGYSFGPSLADIQAHGPWAALSQHLIQTCILGAVLLLAAAPYALGWRHLAFRRETLLLVLSVGMVALCAAASGFPYNVRYTLAGLLAFLGLMAALAAELRRSVWARLSLAGIVAVGLWADGQWFYDAAYQKDDACSVANWLVNNHSQVKTWTVLPAYLSEPVEWYLIAHPEVLSCRCPSKEDRTTSFPPVPNVLILGRRHHLEQAENLVSAYKAAAGKTGLIRNFTGFELYVQEPVPGQGVAMGQ